MKKILTDFRNKILPPDPIQQRVISTFKTDYNIIIPPDRIRISGKNVKIYVPYSDITKDQNKDDIQASLNTLDQSMVFHIIIDQIGDQKTDISSRTKAPQQPTQQQPQFGRHGQKGKINRSHIKTILAVASGKGGVGKSTISLNLARSFARRGLKTGLIDADIHGPSLPVMTGGYKEAAYNNGKLTPHIRDNIKCMSIGFMVNPAKPIIWRGPLVSGAIQQMFSDVDWGDIDVMVIDMPPGTGDAQLTLCQSVSPDASVIVSTPQMTSVIDAERCASMFTQLGTKIVGVIENMRGFVAPDTRKEYFIFGSGGAENFAKAYNFPFLGALPLQMELSYMTDHAKDPAHSENGKSITQKFDDFAQKILTSLDTK